MSDESLREGLDEGRSSFIFRYPGFGNMGQCLVELKKLEPNEIHVTFIEDQAVESNSTRELFDLIATQFYLKRLARSSPESIHWFWRPGSDSAPDKSESIDLVWDGERFTGAFHKEQSIKGLKRNTPAPIMHAPKEAF